MRLGNHTPTIIWFGVPGKEGVVFHYTENQSSTTASDLLGAYRGYVQTDGHSIYGFLGHRDGVTHAGCWAHVRRKFPVEISLFNNIK